MADSDQNPNISRQAAFLQTFGMSGQPSRGQCDETAAVVIQLPPPGLDSAHQRLPEMTVGRLGADLKILDPLLSRKHFVLMQQHGGWCIRDLGSKNGTALNNAPLSGLPKPVRNGDIIVAGASRFRISIAS